MLRPFHVAVVESAGRDSVHVFFYFEPIRFCYRWNSESSTSAVLVAERRIAMDLHGAARWLSKGSEMLPLTLCETRRTTIARGVEAAIKWKTYSKIVVRK